MQNQEAPDRYDAPWELILGNHVGGNRMLKAGGVLDQPLYWFAVQRARYIAHILEDMNSEGFSTVDRLKSGAWTESDIELSEEIRKVREETQRG